MLGSYVEQFPHVKALDTMAANRLQGLPLAPMLVYHLDSVPASALPDLADQFGMMGYAGWVLCDTEAQKRALLKRAFEFKSHHGTPWVIRQLMEIIGYSDTRIIERVGQNYDGSYQHDGAINYGGGDIFMFRVILTVPVGFTLTTDIENKTEGVINYWKPARAKLTEVLYQFE